MKKAIFYLVLLLPATAGVALGQGRRPGGFSSGAATSERPSNNTPKATKMADPYSILLTQSIFARDRRSSFVDRSIAEPIADPPNPETFLAFRGVTVEGDQKVVIFMEDTRDNTLFRLHIGDTVSNTGGKVTSVALDSKSEYVLDYTKRDGQTTSHIPLGNSLANVEVAPPAVADATSSFGGQFGGGAGFGGGFGGRQQFGGGFGGNQYAGGNINDLQAAMGRGGRQRGGGANGFGGPGGGQYGQIDPSGFGTGGGGRQRFGQQGGGQFDPTQQQQGGGGRRGGGGGRRGGGGGGFGG